MVDQNSLSPAWKTKTPKGNTELFTDGVFPSSSFLAVYIPPFITPTLSATDVS